MRAYQYTCLNSLETSFKNRNPFTNASRIKILCGVAAGSVSKFYREVYTRNGWVLSADLARCAKRSKRDLKL